MKKSISTVTKFEVNKKFYFEVVPNENNMVDFSICMEDYPLRVGVFSIPIKNCTMDKWEQIIENNIEDSIRTFFRVLENM